MVVLRQYHIRLILLSCILTYGLQANAYSTNIVVSNSYLHNYTVLNPGTVAMSAGKSSFAFNQIPDNIVEIIPGVSSLKGTLLYQWEQSNSPVTDFVPITGANQSGLSFSAPLLQTTYYRRKVTDQSGEVDYTNTIKILVVSVNHENINYVREHDVLIPEVTDWKIIDQLPIGQKMQTTTYSDGIGRPIQKISKETATPADPQSNTLWGDVVQFINYDAYGRVGKQNLPYTTTVESGKLKSNPSLIQENYYKNLYNETAAYARITYENNPLNRVQNSKSPGQSWTNSAGNSQVYDLNDLSDSVRLLSIDYLESSVPVTTGFYPANSLFKNKYTDENGKQVVEYLTNTGQIILKKIQLSDNPSSGTFGWICTYSVYDDYGRLRFVLQPEAVRYMENSQWIFTSSQAQQVINEWCFRYYYDSRGRNILKKAPGAKELKMIFDERDRVVYMQDGNQRAKPIPEWTVNLYDELDRLTITTLYKSDKTTSQLQTDLAASFVNAVTIVTPPQPITDIVINKRDLGINRYAAQNSITFVEDGSGNFSSGNLDEFTAEIDASVVSEALTITTTSIQSPISQADLNNSAVTTVLKYLFYDNYNYTKVTPFNTTFENTLAYATDNKTVLAISPSKRVLSMPTGSLVRILGSATFLSSSQYYDENGRPIQNLEENIKGGKDITTLQYHYDGRLLSSHSRHQNAGSDFNNFSVLTKHLFDKIGRVISIQKKFGNNNFSNVANYDFDDMGRLKTKHLAPGYSGTGNSELESLNYSYNIHSQITGINKDYALKTAGSYDKWAHYFGLYIGYDNRDGIFTKSELNGQVTGQLWNTMGDDAQRKYDYLYDNAGRLINANFTEKQKPGDTWNTDKMNVSVSGYNGKIEYDLNGNILAMMHKGVQMGSNAAIVIDDLQYTYASFSNKLLKVTDNSPLGSLNGSFGDFKDGTNVNNDDYVYDDNGNLIIDLNKNVGTQAGIAGVTYNFLDKPDQITITGKGQIKIIYDANGSKLQRMYIPEASDKPNATVTTYIDQYLYQETITKTAATAPFTKPGGTVQFLHFEEGRIRIIQPIAESNGLDAIQIAGSLPFPNNKQGVFDYFIRDFQSNVRMILTDENHFSSGTATMEQERSSREEPYFGQPNGANELAQTRFPVNQIPGQLSGSGWQNSGIGNYVSKLGNLAAGKVGPNSLLKVMAGDEISASTQYYFKTDLSNTGSSNITENIVSSLLAALTGGGATILPQKGNISSQLMQNGSFGSFVQPIEGNLGNSPRAYLSVLFFDERFNFIPEGSGQLRATDADNSNANLSLLNLKAPKNGYAYIYVSNSSDVNVYFDNVKLAHTRGRIVEENHYYAFGLRIANISSKKLADQTGNEGNTTNSYLYNDKELFEDGDLGWYDYGFRNYDVQIGRFPQLDPLTDEYHFLTPYQYASDDPISNIDIDGLEGAAATFFKGATMAAATNTADLARLAGNNLPEVILKPSLKKVTSKVVTHSTLKILAQSVKSTLSHILNSFTNKYEFTSQTNLEFNVGVQAGATIKLNSLVNAKLQAGFDVTKFVDLKLDAFHMESAKLNFGLSKSDDNNYLSTNSLNVGLEISAKDFSVNKTFNFGYDYNQVNKFYVSFYGPRSIDSEISQGFLGNLKLSKFKSKPSNISVVNNPSAKVGFNKEKKFYGIDFSGDIKAIFGVKFQLKMGVYEK